MVLKKRIFVTTFGYHNIVYIKAFTEFILCILFILIINVIRSKIL